MSTTQTSANGRPEDKSAGTVAAGGVSDAHPESTTQITPPAVKTRIAKANLDTGWSSLGDAKAKEEFKQKLKAEDLSKVRRSDRTTEPAAAANSPVSSSVRSDAHIASSPGAGASASAGTGAEKQATGGKRDWNKARDSVQQNGPAEAGTAAEAAGGADVSGREGFHEKGRRVDQSRANPPADPDGTGQIQPRDPALERAMRQRAPQQGAVSPNGAANPNVQGQGRGEDKHRVLGQGAVEGQQQGQGQHGAKQGRAPEATPVPSP